MGKDAILSLKFQTFFCCGLSEGVTQLNAESAVCPSQSGTKVLLWTLARRISGSIMWHVHLVCPVLVRLLFLFSLVHLWHKTGIFFDRNWLKTVRFWSSFAQNGQDFIKQDWNFQSTSASTKLIFKNRSSLSTQCVPKLSQCPQCVPFCPNASPICL